MVTFSKQLPYLV